MFLKSQSVKKATHQNKVAERAKEQAVPRAIQRVNGDTEKAKRKSTKPLSRHPWWRVEMASSAWCTLNRKNALRNWPKRELCSWIYSCSRRNLVETANRTLQSSVCFTTTQIKEIADESRRFTLRSCVTRSLAERKTARSVTRASVPTTA